jgi:hypothetical protein
MKSFGWFGSRTIARWLDRGGTAITNHAQRSVREWSEFHVMTHVMTQTVRSDADSAMAAGPGPHPDVEPKLAGNLVRGR